MVPARQPTENGGAVQRRGGWRIRYRVAQFVEALRAPFRPVDRVYVQRLLSRAAAPEDLARLFDRMPRAEQHHGVHVCRMLERRGHTEPDLLIAALFHDVGKLVAPPQLWERVLVVLIEHFAPRTAERWERGPLEGAGLRRAFVVRRGHADWGADLVAGAGGDACTVDLIRGHHGDVDVPVDPEFLSALQSADES